MARPERKGAFGAVVVKMLPIEPWGPFGRSAVKGGKPSIRWICTQYTLDGHRAFTNGLIDVAEKIPISTRVYDV